MIGLMCELDEFGLLMRSFKIKSSFDLTNLILRWKSHHWYHFFSGLILFYKGILTNKCHQGIHGNKVWEGFLRKKEQKLGNFGTKNCQGCKAFCVLSRFFLGGVLFSQDGMCFLLIWYIICNLEILGYIFLESIGVTYQVQILWEQRFFLGKDWKWWGRIRWEKHIVYGIYDIYL